jgi:hypothetical protein
VTPAARQPAGRGGASGRIVGRVLRRDGRPEAGARVAMAGESPDHSDIAQVTGPSGRYGFGALVPGRYTIAAYAEDMARGEASADLGTGEEAELDIILEDEP